MAAEYLNRFLGRAWANAASWRYSADLVNETAAILVNQFGDDWVRKETTPQREPAQSHLGGIQIGQALSIASEDEVIEMIELGRYLVAFKDDPELPTVVNGLKASYRSSLFQLAMAYRLRRQGHAVSLEPEVERSKVADIGISLAGFNVVAECYVPRPPEMMPSQTEIHHLGTQAMECLRDAAHLYSLAIRLRSWPTPASRKKLTTKIKEILAAIEARPGGNIYDIPGLLQEGENWQMSLMRTVESAAGGQSMLVLHPDFPEMDDGDLALFVRAKAGTMADFGLVDKEPQLVSGSHVGIWIDERSSTPVPNDLVVSLAEKIAAKIAQTRLGESRRIVMVRSADVLRMDDAHFGEFQRRLTATVQSHQYLDAVTFHASGFDSRIHRRPFRHRAVMMGTCHPNSRDIVESLLVWDERYTVPIGSESQVRPSLADP
jgi:hypothetical protein